MRLIGADNQKQITGKLKKHCISLLKAVLGECKEQKSKLNRPDWQKEVGKDYEYFHWDIR